MAGVSPSPSPLWYNTRHEWFEENHVRGDGIDSRVLDIANGMEKFAMTGDWRPAVETACDVVSQYLKVRDTVEVERVVQTALASLLYVGHGPYLVRHEYEANGGFTDIAFHPQLDRWPQIGHAALIELKYFKASEKLTRQKLSNSRASRSSFTARSSSSVRKFELLVSGSQ